MAPVASLVVRASASVNKPNFQAMRARVEERRAALETARTMKVQRLQQDIDRIVKREREYSQKLMEEIIPVRVIFNDDAIKRLQDLLPFRIETVAPAAVVTPPPSPADGASVEALVPNTIPSERGTAP
jgi:hypothetical protein